MHVFEVVINKQFDCLFKAFANVPENATTAAWEDVQLGHTENSGRSMRAVKDGLPACGVIADFERVMAGSPGSGASHTYPESPHRGASSFAYSLARLARLHGTRPDPRRVKGVSLRSH